MRIRYDKNWDDCMTFDGLKRAYCFICAWKLEREGESSWGIGIQYCVLAADLLQMIKNSEETRGILNAGKRLGSHGYDQEREHKRRKRTFTSSKVWGIPTCVLPN